MGKHSEWRKIAKKQRRKRIRTLLAKQRDDILLKEQIEREKEPGYVEWFENERLLNEFNDQELQRIHNEEEAKWLEREKLAQKQWKELQEKILILKQERAKQNAKIKEEWEREQKKLQELKEQKQRELEQKLEQQKQLEDQINNYVESGGHMPDSLNTKFETNPGKELCPFFKKNAACRFGDSCSRNHVIPAISNTLLIRNFYSHFGLELSGAEHGETSLETEYRELYEHFNDFFYDVAPEFERFGTVERLVVCRNHEIHLRGNVYVEYRSARDAIKAYRGLNGRYYGGKQLTVIFCDIPSWRVAICGVFYKQNCPKGSLCNFIHNFKNPRNLLNGSNRLSVEFEQNARQKRDEWRWSESPDRYCKETSDWETRQEISSEKRKSRKTSRSSRHERKSSHRSSHRTKRSRYRSESNHSNRKSYRKS